MDERKFAEFIKQQGISENKTYGDILEFLEIRMTEFQDSPKYMEEGAEEIQRLFDEAIAYAGKMADEFESGVVLRKENKKSDDDGSILDKVEELRNRTKNTDDSDPATDNDQSSASGASLSSGSNTNTPSVSSSNLFSSQTGAQNIDALFIQTLDCLKYEEWDKASRMTENILNVEPRNPGAFIIHLLAQYKAKSLQDLELSDKTTFPQEPDFKKAYDFGDDNLKKLLDDLVKNNNDFQVYWKAQKLLQEGETEGSRDKVEEAKNLFSSISSYKDAGNRVDECDEKIAEFIEKQKEDLERQKENTYRYAIGKYDEYEGKLDIIRLNSHSWNSYNEVDREINSYKEPLEREIKNLKSIKDYQDSSQYIDKFESLISDIESIGRQRKDVFNKKYARGERKKAFLEVALFILMFLLGPGFGKGIGYSQKYEEIGFYSSEPLYRFIPVPITLTDQWGKVYLGFGDLNYDANESGLPLFAPFAKIHARYEKMDDLTELEITREDSTTVKSCNNLETIKFSPRSDDGSFTIENCDSLKKIEIDSDIKQLSVTGCLKLTEIVFNGEVKSSISIEDCEKLDSLELQKGKLDRISIKNSGTPSSLTLPEQIHKANIENCPKLSSLVVYDVLMDGELYYDPGEVVVKECDNLRGFEIKGTVDDGVNIEIDVIEEE